MVMGVSFLTPVLDAAPVVALTEAQMYFYGQNNILFYDPDGKGVNGRTCFGTLSGSTLYEKVLSYLLSMGLTEEAAAGVYGNMMHEGLGSGALLSHENGVDEQKDIGTWYSAATYYGENGLLVAEKDVRDLDDPEVMHGLGFIQWSFGRRVRLLQALAAAGGLDKYAREWDDQEGRYVYDGVAYDQLADMIGQSEADAILAAELNFFNTEHQNYVVAQSDVAAQGLGKYGITEGMNIIEALNLVETPEEAAELFFSTSEMPGATGFNAAGNVRQTSAREGYELIKSAGVTASGATSCGGNGNIADTAIMLSWEGLDHAKDDPKPEYVKAMQEVGTYVDPCNETGCAPRGASCDIFVSTVIRYSGADANFPPYGPAVQQAYMDEHPEMYEKIEADGDVRNLMPGDIFVVANGNGRHIYLYIGEIDGQPSQASASFNTRTGEHYAGISWVDYDMEYSIYRRI